MRVAALDRLVVRETLRTLLVGLLAGVFTLLVLAVVLPVVFVGLLLVGTTAPWLLSTGALLVAGHAATGGTIAGYLRDGRRIDDALVGALAAALVLAVVGLLIGLFGTLVVYGFATMPIDRPMAKLARYSLIVAAAGGLGGCGLGALGGLAGRRLRRARRRTDEGGDAGGANEQAPGQDRGG